MTCKYAFNQGKMEVLEKLREWCNEKFKESRELANDTEPERAYWWRAQGQSDITHALLEKLGDLIAENDKN